jgi:hypothetical protein
MIQNGMHLCNSMYLLDIINANLLNKMGFCRFMGSEAKGHWFESSTAHQTNQGVMQGPAPRRFFCVQIVSIPDSPLLAGMLAGLKNDP